MIVRGLANRLIKDFGYRLPSDAEKETYEETLKKFRDEGGAIGGQRPNDIAIFVAKIESDLTKLFINEFLVADQKKEDEILTGEEKIARIMKSLLDSLSDTYKNLTANIEEPLKGYLKKIDTGLRTAILIIGLELEMLAKFFDDVKMATAFSKPLINNAYATINEIAGLPQTGILHPFLNFLCGKKLDYKLSTTAITDHRFDISKFTFEGTDIGVSEKAYKEFERLHKEACKEVTIVSEEMTFSEIYEHGKTIPVFRCPAKRAYINLEKFNLGEVNFIKATYLLALRKCSNEFNYT